MAKLTKRAGSGHRRRRAIQESFDRATKRKATRRDEQEVAHKANLKNPPSPWQVASAKRAEKRKPLQIAWQKRQAQIEAVAAKAEKAKSKKNDGK